MPNEVSDPIIAFFREYKWLILIVVTCLIIGYSSVLVLGKNNPIEEEVEKLIEMETGVKVKLTP